MRFTPKSAKEIAEEGLYPEGEYPFQISQANEKISKSGNEMIEVWVRVFKDDKFKQVPDYLLESMAYKLRHICEATGLLESYESGQLQAVDLVGKEGFLKLGIQKDKEGKYPDKNVVKDYIVSDEKPKIPQDPLSKTLDDMADEIPF